MNLPLHHSRRRFLSITAACAGLGLIGNGAWSRESPAFQSWQGTALGARASIRLAHPKSEVANALIAQARDEIRRLEQGFSVYRADSAISVLNREGMLEAPPLDLVRLLAEARTYSELTGGAFDVTVQPLWQLYARHFALVAADPKGPRPEAVAQALARVDFAAVAVDSSRIAFEKPGMAITLNGIAQGYITDRVADLFRRAGLTDVLIDLGEIRALGHHPDGRPWRIGLKDPRDESEIAETIALENRALATSAGAGTRFDATGRHHHLFDPRTGLSTNRYLSVTVTAPTATAADALSTGLFQLDEDRIGAVMRRRPGAKAFVTTAKGELRTWPGAAFAARSHQFF